MTGLEFVPLLYVVPISSTMFSVQAWHFTSDAADNAMTAEDRQAQLQKRRELLRLRREAFRLRQQQADSESIEFCEAGTYPWLASSTTGTVVYHPAPCQAR